MKNPDLSRGTVVALGNFDGLHLGHQSVLNRAKELAEELDAIPCICTFREHPLKFLTGRTPPMLLTGSLKEEAYDALHMELYAMDFSEVKDLEPEAFFKNILLDTLHAKGVCCGFNFTFGAGGRGTPERLGQLCAEQGIVFSAMPEVTLDQHTVSSTEIRKAMKEGRLEAANCMLGRPFAFRGTVRRGDGRGHTWGMPTVNQEYPEELVTPAFGVYVSRVTVDGETYYGVTNIGVRPTVRAGEKTSAETFILDFEEDVYGKEVTTELLRFLRPEQRFENFDALKTQMKQDIAKARDIIPS